MRAARLVQVEDPPGRIECVLMLEVQENAADFTTGRLRWRWDVVPANRSEASELKRLRSVVGALSSHALQGPASL